MALEADPGYPITNINVNEKGMTITVVLAPGLSLVRALGPEAMDQITALWNDVRAKQKQHIPLIQDILRTKNQK